MRENDRSSLQDAAVKVKVTEIPNCNKKHLQRRVGYIFAVPVILLIAWGIIIASQIHPNMWTTNLVRVQFSTSADDYDLLKVYNGCYVINTQKKLVDAISMILM